MKTLSTLIIWLAASVVLTGCATNQAEYLYVYEPVQCELPVLPTLPIIYNSELTLKPDVLERLVEYESLVVDSLHVHREMLRTICDQSAPTMGAGIAE
jgi:hypothetical protein